MSNLVSVSLQEKTQGYVLLLENSLFSGLIIIDACVEKPQIKVRELSLKTPGEYRVCFSAKCENPFEIKENVLHQLKNNWYAGHFYQIATPLAIKIIKREINRISVVNC